MFPTRVTDILRERESAASGSVPTSRGYCPQSLLSYLLARALSGMGQCQGSKPPVLLLLLWPL